jgi:hypothetical protein
VIECKDRKLGLHAALAELGNAAANREAGAAVMVFARQQECPVPEPFAVFDNLALLVVDKDEPDVVAIRLVCAWARAQVLAGAGGVANGFDPAEARGRVDDARCTLGRISAIRRAHTMAVKQIQQAAGQVDDLNAELIDALDQIERATAA